MGVGDVLPRRNLPAEAENWGRAVERRAQAARAEARNTRQFVEADYQTTQSLLNTAASQIRQTASWGGAVQTVRTHVNFVGSPANNIFFVTSVPLTPPPGAIGAQVYALPATTSNRVSNGSSSDYSVAFVALLNPGVPPEGVDPYDAVYNNNQGVWYLGDSGFSSIDPADDSGFRSGAVMSPAPAIDIWAERSSNVVIQSLDIEWPMLVQWF